MAQATTEVTIFIKMSTFSKVLAESVTAAVASDVVAQAKSRVRVGATGNLKGSIKALKIGPAQWITQAQTEYAAAQEWGLAPYGKPNYGFTPYMRPAAMKAASFSNLVKIVSKASIKAFTEAKV